MKTFEDYTYGFMVENERQGLYQALTSVFEVYKKINIIEVGCRDLRTGKAMISICKDNDINYNYYGIDLTSYKTDLLDNMNLVLHNANDPNILEKLPGKFHFVLIDACHCEECVKKQMEIYLNRIVISGFLVFHDTSDQFQNSGMPESHDPTKDLYVRVRKVLDEINLENNGFKLIYDDRKSFYGITCYKRIFYANK